MDLVSFIEVVAFDLLLFPPVFVSTFPIPVRINVEVFKRSIFLHVPSVSSWIV